MGDSERVRLAQAMARVPTLLEAKQQMQERVARITSILEADTTGLCARIPGLEAHFQDLRALVAPSADAGSIAEAVALQSGVAADCLVPPVAVLSLLLAAATEAEQDAIAAAYAATNGSLRAIVELMEAHRSGDVAGVWQLFGCRAATEAMPDDASEEVRARAGEAGAVSAVVAALHAFGEDAGLSGVAPCSRAVSSHVRLQRRARGRSGRGAGACFGVIAAPQL